MLNHDPHPHPEEEVKDDGKAAMWTKEVSKKIKTSSTSYDVTRKREMVAYNLRGSGTSAFTEKKIASSFYIPACNSTVDDMSDN